MKEKPVSKLPVIASITKPEQIEAAIHSQVSRVILMAGDILQLGDIISRLHQSQKRVYIHLEMVNGIGRDHAAVQYLATTYRIDGIVSTKTNAISAAKQAGISSIQRFFAIDTAAVDMAVKVVNNAQPDEVELMPGLMPRIIQEVKSRINRPLIVGGLIRYKEEALTALESGADYISTGDKSFW